MLKTTILKILKHPRVVFLMIVLLLVLGSLIKAVTAAWTEPTADPPDENVAAPINISDIAQYKKGALSIGVDVLPVETLEVADITGGTARVRISDIVQNPELQLQYGSGPDEHWAIYSNQDNADSLNIWSYNAGSGGNRVTILQNGNVGIGPTNPSEKLEVSGNIKASGTICDSVGCIGGGVAGGGKTGPTLIVAANDSNDKTRADYVCDGTDDEVQINQAISALPAAGGTVYLLEGTYVVNPQTLISGTTYYAISLNSNVALIGSGAGTVIKLKDSWNGNGRLINANTKNSILLQNFKIDGNKGGQSGGSQDGIVFTTVTKSKINKLWVENVDVEGIAFKSSSNNNIISSCHFVSNSGSAIDFTSGSYNIISGNNIQSSGGSAIDFTSGSYNIISGNNIQSSGGRAIELKGSGNDYNIISGNNIQSSSNAGIDICGGADYNTVSNNNVSANARGIVIYNSSDSNTISDNVIVSNSSYGIQVHTGNYNAIVGNTLNNNGGTGTASSIHLDTADTTLISSNNIYDSAGTGYAIKIGAGADNNILVGNRYSGTGASSIKDQGINTIYNAQLAGSSGSDLILKSSGNVGINTTAPAAKLVVKGDMTASKVNKVIVVDGVTYSADGSGIQAAINALPAGGGKVFLPEGTYTISATLTLASNVILEGAGKTATILNLANGVNAAVISATNASNIRIALLKIDANNTNNNCSHCHGLYLTNVDYSTIDNIWLEDCEDDAIYFYSGSNNNAVTNSTFNANAESAIHVYSSSYNTIANNNVVSNGDRAIELYPSSTYNTVLGNILNSNSGTAVHLCASSNYNVVGDNVIKGNRNGITLDRGCHNNTITGNNLSANTGYGIALTSCGGDNNVISNNVIYDNGAAGGYSGIYLANTNDGSDNNIIASNVIYDSAGTGYAINISGSYNDNNVLVGNRITGFAWTTSKIRDLGAATIYNAQLVEDHLVLKPTGNVGIGTAKPTNSRLVIEGDGGGSYQGQSGYDVSIEGKLYVTAGCAGDITCSDIAEFISAPKDEPFESGDVVIINPGSKEYVTKSYKPFDSRVAGIFSAQPGLLIRGGEGMSFGNPDFSKHGAFEHNGSIPLALAGQVPVKVTSKNGFIKKGDLLTTSSIPGHAMKFALLEFTGEESSQELANKLNKNEQRRNSILGKALEACYEITCKIMVLVTLQ
ncbi:right-handed parallel beta-helix repeat-containing protein [Patescibacteria group bacterium]|nr:right-handed parallel beta-helix repeat-containing protein [Patescibacteria group bacterium]